MTCTTAALAVLGSAWNPVMPIRSLSLFAGTLVICNFFFSLMVIPPTLVIFDKIEKGCCNKNKGNKDDDKVARDLNVIDNQYSPMDNFFGQKWNNFVSHKIGKIVIFIIFIGWTAYASYVALEVPFKTYIEEFVPEGHESQIVKKLYNDKFAGAEDLSRVYFVWGIDDINLDQQSLWNSRQVGEPVIDRNFDPLDQKTFSKLFDFCQNLRTQEFVAQGSVDCWVKDLSDWVIAQGIRWVPSNKYAAQNYFLQWLKQTDEGIKARDTGKVGVVDGHITYMQISALSRVDTTSKISVKLAEYDKWQQYAKKWESKLPVTAKSIFQTSLDAWAWIPTQMTNQEQSYQGAIIATVFSFITLLFATQNVVIAVMTILCLYSIFVTILAILTFANWPLGIAEIMCMVIVMGLSVDNTVHMAHDYQNAPQIDRGGKMKQAYLQKGKTLTSTSLAILLSACFLFGAQITIFYNYAVAIIGTIIISYVMSMVFFGSLCHLMGPSSGVGDMCGRLPGHEHEEELEMIRIKQEMQV